jgi:hypothetical protein
MSLEKYLTAQTLLSNPTNCFSIAFGNIFHGTPDPLESIHTDNLNLVSHL